jgi:GNAT superfamily N-acetyltransferase
MVLMAAPRPYRIREITPDDRDELRRFYAGLSPESRQARFHGTAPEVGGPAAAYFCRPDHAHREGLVAEAVDADGHVAIIGHVCLEPAEPGVAEMAIAVADAWQRRGVGRALLAAATDWARAHGIATLSASMLWGNAPVLALVRSMGCPITFGATDGGTVEALVRIGGVLPNAA